MPDTKGGAEPKKRRSSAQIKYAVYNLADALDVATAIHRQGGGMASVDELAAYMGYKSSNNGAYYDRTSAARMFGLIQGQGAQITLTPRAQEILMPVYPEQAAKAKTEAFLDVALFRAIFEEFQGRQLPPASGLKNLMRTKYGVPPSRIDQAYKALMDSAELAGFFATRGAPTHLILPRARSSDARVTAAQGAEDEPRAEDDARSAHNPAPAASRDDLQNLYVSALIDMLRQKGEPDPELMGKIESLLGLAEREK